MCLIALNFNNKMSKDDFDKAWERNDDGVGFSWFNDNGTISFKKGFMVKESAWEFFEKMQPPFTIHFRAASPGMPISPELTHPFIVSAESPLLLEGNADRVLFMNGTNSWWPEFLVAADILEDGQMSDTRAIAMIVGKNQNDRMLKKICAKFILVDSVITKENPKPNNWLYKQSDFTLENGIYYSNLTFRSGFHKCSKTFSKKKTQKIMTIGSDFSASNYVSDLSYNNWDKPWKNCYEPEVFVLKYLLGKMSKKSSKKLWNKYNKALQKKDKDKGVSFFEEKAIKTIKQQDKTFTAKEEERILQLIKRRNSHPLGNTLTAVEQTLLLGNLLDEVNDATTNPKEICVDINAS